MIDLRSAVVGLAALGGVAVGSAPAAAMPNGMPAPGDRHSIVEEVVMVCNAWARCWYRPNYYVGARVYRYGYIGPRYHGHRRREGRR
jgi:hypothetical protein